VSLYISQKCIFISRSLYTKEGRNSIAVQHGLFYSLSKLQTISFVTSIFIILNFMENESVTLGVVKVGRKII